MKKKVPTKKSGSGDNLSLDSCSGMSDLKAVNPNKKPEVDDRTPADLLALIEANGREITEALASLRT